MKKSDKAIVIAAIYYFIGKVSNSNPDLTYDYVSSRAVHEILDNILEYFPEVSVILYAKYPQYLQKGIVADIERTILNAIRKYFSTHK